jgi:hypothetical protein
MVRPSVTVFFERGPVLVPPGANRRFVALGRALDGPLDTVADRVQQPTNVGWVVRDTEGASDHLGHPPAGPDLATESVCFRSWHEQRRQLSKLLAGEPRLATWSGMAPQRLDTLVARSLKPLADRARRHSQRGGDVLLCPAVLFELPGASPPSFAPVELGFFRAHGASLSSL